VVAWIFEGIFTSRPRFAADLVEVIVEKSERTSTEAEFSDEIPGLSKAGHVAALLRY